MAEQYIAIVEETTRGTDPGSGYLFLPVMSNIQPVVEYQDEPRKEFRGADTALGDSSVVRRSGQWKMTIECAFYPGAETGLLLKHAVLGAGTRAAVDTTAYRGILYPESMPYGTGATFGDKAIGIIANTDEGGTTKSQYYGGGRITSVKIVGDGVDDVKLTFEVQGPAEYIGPVDQTATAGVSFPAAAPYSTDDCQLYIGSGVSRTGTAPDYTAISAGTAQAFRPDKFEVTLTNGLDDKNVMDGNLGPAKTYRSAQFKADGSTPVDYEDPSSGFSSADQWKQIFSGPTTTSLLITMDNGETAGATTETYHVEVDLPHLLLTPGTPERKSDGTQPTVDFTMVSLYSDTTNYPAAIMTTDQESAY